MGGQLNDIKISGTFGGLSFYHHKVYGELVRKKGGPSRKKVKTAENFANTRRQNTEFGGVSKANKLLRHGLRPFLFKESTMTSRLQAVLWQVLKSDSKSTWGERTLSKALTFPDGKLKLEDYEVGASHPFMRRIDVILKDDQVSISWNKKAVGDKTALCLAITVGTLGVDFTNYTKELRQGSPVFFTRSASSKQLSIAVPSCSKQWPFEFIVLRVQKARKLKNEILVNDDADCALTVLKVREGGRTAT